MAKISNFIRFLPYNSEEELYSLLENSITDNKKYKVNKIEFASDNKALVYFEEDLKSIEVHFFYCENELANSKIMMSYQDIDLINELGTITLSDRQYDIEEIEYCIDSDSKFLKITLG